MFDFECLDVCYGMKQPDFSVNHSNCRPLYVVCECGVCIRNLCRCGCKWNVDVSVFTSSLTGSPGGGGQQTRS